MAGGLVAVIEVAEFTVNAIAVWVPKVTPVAPVNPEPVTVTTVPPAVRPDGGETPETIGAVPPLPEAATQRLAARPSPGWTR